MGFSLKSGAGVDGNAPYKARVVTDYNPDQSWDTKNFLPPRPVQS